MSCGIELLQNERQAAKLLQQDEANFYPDSLALLNSSSLSQQEEIHSFPLCYTWGSPI